MRNAKRWLAVLVWAAALPAWAQQGGESAEAARSNTDDINPAVDFSPELTRQRRAAPDAAAEPGRAREPSSPAPPRAAPEPRSTARGGAVDALNLGTTSITGNQELPRVLYIVPWKQSDLGDLVGRPVDTLLDEVLAPIDPEVFERHVTYYETLYGDSQEEPSQ